MKETTAIQPFAAVARLRPVSDVDVFWRLHVPRLLSHGNATPLRGLSAVARFTIHGPGGGEWTVTIREGRIEEVGEGALGEPTLSVSVSAEEFLRIATGESDHQESFFSGRVQVSGDLETLLAAANWIPLLRERFPFSPESYREAGR